MTGSTPSAAEIGRPGLAPSMPAYRVTQTAVLLGAACLLALVESLLPPVAMVPWLRLGLANIAVVVALAVGGPLTAVAVSGGRLLIVGFATGGLAGPAFAMATAGAAASLLAMWVLSRYPERFTPVGWSAAGAVAHVLAQFAVAAALLGSPSVWNLAPISALFALAFGALVGHLARTVVSRLPNGRLRRG